MKLHSTPKHTAFLLLDAIMGIFVCACGFALAFSVLSMQDFKPNVYASYKHLLLQPSTMPAQIEARSTSLLIYEGKTHRTTESNLTLFIPTHIR